ncbi:unnamed protein product, partial [Cylindrotheca closterium]
MQMDNRSGGTRSLPSARPLRAQKHRGSLVMNVEVDNWAVAYRHQLEASNQLIAPNSRFFTELAALYIGGVKQSRLDPDYIQELVALPALRKRWHEKLTVTPEAESETDWPSLARAMRSLPAGVQRWTTKHVVGMCGVGKFK